MRPVSDPTQDTPDAGPGQPDAAPPRTSGRRSWLRRALRTLGVLALLLALAGLAAVASGGESGLLVVLLAALAAWVLPLILVATVLLAATRWWRATAVAGVLLVASGVWLFQLPAVGAAHASEPATGDRLRVMAQNLRYGQADPAQLVAQVRERRPDVLVLTELTPEAVTALRAAGLDDVLGHSFTRPGPFASGTGIWTREPLLDPAAIPGTEQAAVSGTLLLPDGTRVAVAGVHPQAPTDLDTWQSDFRVLTRALAPAGFAPGGRPALVAGDFNAAVTNGPLARLLATGWRDGALQAGGTLAPWFGAGQTWPAGFPIPNVIRIDHVLTTAGTDVTDVDTFQLSGTDHLGVVADLRLPAG